MANTLNLGNGNWGVKKDSLLGYNSENGNFKPLPFDFTRASSATVVNKAGLIETVGSGEPRIDFSNDAKGALLLEPTRSNLVTYSNDFSGWNGAQFTTPNYAISPDGTQNASRLLFTGASQVLLKTTSLASGVSCSATFYVKGNAGETIQLAAGGIDTMHTLNGSWQRLETNQTSVNSTILLNTFGGSNARDLLVWGSQLEEGSYATSYIPTQGSAVTRVADVCNNGGDEQVINSTEGVLYAEISGFENDTSFRTISLSDGSNINEVQLLYSGNTNIIRAILTSNAVTQVDFNYTMTNGVNYNKIAFTYKQNNFQLWVNGIKRQSDTIGNTSNNLNKIRFQNGVGSANFYGNVKDIRLYNTILTDSELTALTTI